MRPKNLEKEEAIRAVALQIIADEGLENLSMQKLAKAANISPRTIYIKYRDKEDLLVKLLIEEVLGAYEQAVLTGFDENMDLEQGIKKIWRNTFFYFRENRPSFVLMQYGKSSPLLNKAFREKNIEEGAFFAPVHRFLKHKIKEGRIRNYPHAIHRALLFAPLMDLINEYFDHSDGRKQIITEKRLMECCEGVIKGMQL